MYGKLKPMENEDIKGGEGALPVYLDIPFDINGNILDNLYEDKSFQTFVIECVYKKIEFAIENDLDSVKLFNIFNASLIIEVNKSQYKSILEHIIHNYAQYDNFEECIKITNLINEL